MRHYKVTFTHPDRSIGARHFATLEEAEGVARMDGGSVSEVIFIRMPGSSANAVWDGGREFPGHSVPSTFELETDLEGIVEALRKRETSITIYPALNGEGYDAHFFGYGWGGGVAYNLALDQAKSLVAAGAEPIEKGAGNWNESLELLTSADVRKLST